MGNQFDKIGRVSSESVQKHTKKPWKEWIKILDQAGARQWDHREIVDFLKRKHRISGWWQQIVTSGYEIAIGRRVEGQNTKGLWSLTATKTVAGDHKAIWNFVLSQEALPLWLQPLDEVDLSPKETYENHLGVFGEVRTIQEYRSLRMTWKDPEWQKHSVLQFWCVPRPNGKTIAVFTHDNLPTPRAQEEMRKHWKESLERIAKAFGELVPKKTAGTIAKSSKAEAKRKLRTPKKAKTSKTGGSNGNTRTSSRKNDRSPATRRRRS